MKKPVNIKNLIIKPKLITLPQFPLIKPGELNPLDVLLNMDTNKFTAWGEQRVRGYPYDKVPTHAYLHIRHGIILNVGLIGVYTEELSYYTQKSQQILVIHFTDINWELENRLIDAALREFTKRKKLKVYDFRGYGSFFPGLGKVIKPSDENDFCSENCVEVGQDVRYQFFMGMNGSKESPADLLLRALKTNDPAVQVCELNKAA